MLPSFTVLHCISNRVYFPRNINQVKMMRWKLARLEAFFFFTTSYVGNLGFWGSEYPEGSMSTGIAT
jgi:hypothetical protein